MKQTFKIVAGIGLLSFLSVSFLLAEESAPSADQTAAPVKKSVIKKKKHYSVKKASDAKEKTTETAGASTPKSTTPAESKAPALTAQAAASTSALDTWLKKIKDRLMKAQTKNNKLVAVAAVRGSETKEAPPLYWKGLKTEGEVRESELKEFQAAVDETSKGSKDEAQKKFTAFVSAYPKSPLVEEAEKAISLLKEEPAKANPAP